MKLKKVNVPAEKSYRHLSGHLETRSPEKEIEISFDDRSDRSSRGNKDDKTIVNPVVAKIAATSGKLSYNKFNSALDKPRAKNTFAVRESNSSSYEDIDNMLEEGKIAEVLLIDDQQFNLSAMQGQLTEFGVASDTAMNGEKALEALEQRL